jgi:class 3 adenylate cyclase
LEALRNSRWDLVLLDYVLPGRNGLEVLRERRADAAMAAVPVIVVTGHGDSQTAVNCIEAGADDYLEKPMQPVVMLARVNAALARHRAQEQQRELLMALATARARSDDLLRQLLPSQIAEELSRSSCVRPTRHENVAVLFIDLVDFTHYCVQRDPAEIHETLQMMFQVCERVSQRFCIEKIKTVGDCFMGAAGLLSPGSAPVLDCTVCAQTILREMREQGAPLALRAGIDHGAVIAGIVGGHRYCYDIWGDTVNTAARVQEFAQPGAVALGRGAWAQVSTRVTGAWQGPYPARGKPDLEIFEVTGVHP